MAEPTPKKVHLIADHYSTTMCGLNLVTGKHPNLELSQWSGNEDDPDPTCKTCLRAHAAEGQR